MKDIDELLAELDNDDIFSFAENHCCWYDTDYYDECEYDESNDAWYHPNSKSIVDSALAAIRDWAVTDDNLEILRAYCVNS